jgi:hypothetical protein
MIVIKRPGLSPSRNENFGFSVQNTRVPRFWKTSLRLVLTRAFGAYRFVFGSRVRFLH